MPARTGLKIVVLLVAGGGAAAFTNAVRPGRLAWVIDPKTSTKVGENPALAAQADINLESLRTHILHGTATIIDARKPEEYSAGHVAGAINIPSTEKERQMDRVFQLPPDLPIIIYCGGGPCEASHEVFDFLVGSGIPRERLHIFAPGWEVLGAQPDIPQATGLE